MAIKIKSIRLLGEDLVEIQAIIAGEAKTIRRHVQGWPMMAKADKEKVIREITGLGVVEQHSSVKMKVLNFIRRK